MSDYPKRAVTVTLTISADSDDEVRHALRQIETEMAMRADRAGGGEQIGPGFSVGYGSSWTVAVERHPEQTHEKCEAELHSHVAALDAKQEPRA